MPNDTFSNRYEISNTSVYPVKNKTVVDVLAKTKKWCSHFYLAIEFDNPDKLQSFLDEVAKEVERNIEHDEGYLATTISSDLKEKRILIPLACRWGKGHIAVDDKRTKELIAFLSESCQYDFNNALDKNKLEQRDPQQWGMLIGLGLGYLTSIVGVVAFSYYNIFSFGLIALSGLAGMFLLNALDKFKVNCNEEYLSKSDEAIQALTESHKKSFELGQKAADSYLVQFKSCFNPDSVLHPKAYYAGMLSEQVDSPLERDLKGKLKLNN